MKLVTIGNRNVPAIIQGCMRIGNLDTKSLQNLIEKQLESGVNFWDHADIYGGGTCETIFGEALHQMPGMRDKLILQSKCGIRPGAFTCYDFSKAHIICKQTVWIICSFTVPICSWNQKKWQKPLTNWNPKEKFFISVSATIPPAR